MASTDPEHISISKSKGIKIDWKDGLPANMACATAPSLSVRGLHRLAWNRAQAPPLEESPSPFQMYQPALKMVSESRSAITQSVFYGAMATAAASTPSSTCEDFTRVQT